jgi:hypothetical protein
MTILIGLTGRAHSGKDTAACMIEAICLTAGINQQTFAFATSMRAALRALGVPPDYIKQPELKNKLIPELGASYRQLMQELGDMGRKVLPDFWVRFVARSISNLPDGVGLIVITDVRYPNEAEWIRANGGVIVQLNRKAAPEVRSHSSEQHFAELQAEYVIDNNGTLAELEARLAALLVKLDATAQALGQTQQAEAA